LRPHSIQRMNLMWRDSTEALDELVMTTSFSNTRRERLDACYTQGKHMAPRFLQTLWYPPQWHISHWPETYLFHKNGCLHPAITS
jgi:hypothetical protein